MNDNDKKVDETMTQKTPPNEVVDDIKYESYNDDMPDGGVASPEEKIKKLKEKLKQSEKERLEYLDGWQRAKADFVNYKKRDTEGREEFMKFAKEGLISDLLPVLDSFGMAFANKEAWAKVDPSWRVGVEYIHTQLLQVLSDSGLVEVNPKDALFDSKEHTAIGVVPTTDAVLAHKIAEVIQKGYSLNGKLVKSPIVKVYEVGEMQPEGGE